MSRAKGLGSATRDEPSVQVPDEFKSRDGLADRILKAKEEERARLAAKDRRKESRKDSGRDKGKGKGKEREKSRYSSASDSDSSSSLSSSSFSESDTETDSDSDSDSDLPRAPRGRRDSFISPRKRTNHSKSRSRSPPRHRERRYSSTRDRSPPPRVDTDSPRR
jgi:hypothetical protein